MEDAPFLPGPQCRGGKGTLSEFQKQVRQQRCQAYAEEITATALTTLCGLPTDRAGHIVFFNPHPYSWSEPVTLQLPAATDLSKFGLSHADGSGEAVPWQLDESKEDGFLIRVVPRAVPPVGYQVCSLDEDAPPGRSKSPGDIQVEDQNGSITLDNGTVRLSASKLTGDLTELVDLQRDADWGGERVGRIYALREHGNDVAMVLSPQEEELGTGLRSCEVVARGPLFARLRIVKDLRGCAVEQLYTLWAGSGRVDCRTEICWDGARNWHLRQGLPTTVKTQDVVYGSPFFASRWTDIMPGANPRTEMRCPRQSMVSTGNCRAGCTSSDPRQG